MKILKRLATLTIAALVLPACTSVYVPEPMGDEIVKLDPAEWQGTWIGPEMVVMTTVLDADKGLIQSAWLERRDGGVEFETTVGQMRSSGGVVYANIEDNNEEAGRRFHWSRIDRDGRQVTIWTPRVQGFEAMIEEGRIPGKVTGDGVVLEKLTAEHLALINDASSGLLDWNTPAVFYRIGD